MVGDLTTFYNAGFAIEVAKTSAKIGAGISSNGSSWDIGWISGTTALSGNSWYYIKLSFNGSQYLLELSTDGTNYITEGSLTSSVSIFQNENTVQLGDTATHSGDYWAGQIDLSGSYIKINNVVWWQPYTTVEAYATESFKGILVGTDDGTAKTYNLFYNKGTYLLDTVSTKTGYSWAGSVYVPSHTV